MYDICRARLCSFDDRACTAAALLLTAVASSLRRILSVVVHEVKDVTPYVSPVGILEVPESHLLIQKDEAGATDVKVKSLNA